MTVLLSLDRIYQQATREEYHPFGSERRVLHGIFRDLNQQYTPTPAASNPSRRVAWREERIDFPAFEQLRSVENVKILWRTSGVVSRALLSQRMPLLLDEARHYIVERHGRAVRDIPAHLLLPMIPAHFTFSDVTKALDPKSINSTSREGLAMDELFLSILEHPSALYGDQQFTSDGVILPCPEIFASLAVADVHSGLPPFRFRQDAHAVACWILNGIPSPTLRSMTRSQQEGFGGLFISGCGYRGYEGMTLEILVWRSILTRMELPICFADRVFSVVARH